MLMKKIFLAFGITAMTFSACLGNMTMVQAASLSGTQGEPSQAEQRAMLSESNFFSPGRLGQAATLYGTGDKSKKAAIFSPGKFGIINCKGKNMWSENKNKKITWLSPGQFGEKESYLYCWKEK